MYKRFPTQSGSKPHNLQPTNITFYELCASDVNLMFVVLNGGCVLEVKWMLWNWGLDNQIIKIGTQYLLDHGSNLHGAITVIKKFCKIYSLTRVVYQSTFTDWRLTIHNHFICTVFHQIKSFLFLLLEICLYIHQSIVWFIYVSSQLRDLIWNWWPQWRDMLVK